jgi:hypothetical protein
MAFFFIVGEKILSQLIPIEFAVPVTFMRRAGLRRFPIKTSLRRDTLASSVASRALRQTNGLRI